MANHGAKPCFACTVSKINTITRRQDRTEFASCLVCRFRYRQQLSYHIPGVTITGSCRRDETASTCFQWVRNGTPLKVFNSFLLKSDDWSHWVMLNLCLISVNQVTKSSRFGFQ